MDITYFGHSSFKIKGKSAAIITDPFDPEMVGIKFPKVTDIDIVTVSHSHEDHNFLENIKEPKLIINEPGEYEVSGVTVLGIPTFHDDKKGELRGKNNVYIFEIDGLRIAHLGDLGHKLSEETIEDLGSIDVLLIPVGGFYTINAAVACETVRAIEPSFVVPMHYKRPETKGEVFKDVAPVEDFLKESGMSVENMEKLSLKKLDIIETESKVVVLEVKS